MDNQNVTNNITTTTTTTTTYHRVNPIITSDIPKTPIPTSSSHQSCDNDYNNSMHISQQQTQLTSSSTTGNLHLATTMDMTKTAQQTLMLNTYSLVGAEYLEALADQIRTMTKAQTVMIQQVITMDECNNIIERLERQGIQVNLASRDDSSIEPEQEEDLSHCLQLLSQQQQKQQHLPYNNNQLLLTRACSSGISSEPTSKYCVTPLALLQETPPLKTLMDGSYISINDQQHYHDHSQQEHYHEQQSDNDNGDSGNMMDFTHDNACDSFLPPHTSFVGIRLQGPNALPLGLLYVCDNTVKEDQWLDDTFQLLSCVSTRTMRELAGIRDSERLIKAKNDAVQDAENKIKFLADMSHEIRTPMNAVIALTDLLLQERSSLNDEQIEHLDVIQTSGHHLLTVINDILDISKINHDPKFKLENRRFSLRKCIKDALNMARHQASMSQLNKMVYVVECPPDMDDNVPVQHTIASLERLGILPPLASQYKNKVLLPLIWNIDSDVPDYLMGDTMRLTQILLNLCSNAVKFTKKGGIRVRIKRYVPTPIQTISHQSKLKQRYEARLETIYTRAMQGKDSKFQDDKEASAGASDDDEEGSMDNEGRLEKTILEICVTDTGIGIPADRLPRLFKSFSQIDISTARRYGGTGLGLAISSTLVNRMGGGLWVESEEGVGSRFALTLPMTIALGRCMRTYGSESTTTSSFVTSPPSPSSSVSDGSGSVNSGIYERSDSSSHSYNVMSPAQSSTSSGYFPSVPHHHQQQVNSINHRLRQQSSWSLFSPRQQQQQQQQYYQQQQQHPLINITPFDSLSDHGKHSVVGPSSSPTNSNVHPSHPSYSSSDMANRPTSSSSSLSSSPSQQPALESKSDQFQQKRPLLRRGEASQTGSSFHTERTVSTNEYDNGNSKLEYPSSTSSAPASSGRAAFRGPATKTSSKHHHQRKNTGSDENFALMYPVKILLAEDNVLNQKIAVSILKRLGYHDVVVTNNGKEALEIMQKIKFDVIFMDLYMPEMDGLEATREIISARNSNKEDIRLLNVDDVYIIALTASASNQDRQICIDAGMNDFISKPFTMMEMKASLKTCGNKRAKRRKQRKDDDSLTVLSSSSDRYLVGSPTIGDVIMEHTDAPSTH